MYLREKEAGRVELGLSVEQLKKLYLAMFRQLHAGGSAAFDDLDDDDMLLTIQTYLQRVAREAGIDCTDHAAWDAFLGVTDAPSCARRFANRAEA